MKRDARRPWPPPEQRGAVLVLALMVLAGLVALAMSLLSIGGLEPQISRNHAATVKARYLAEAGLEHAYDVLMTDVGAWSAYLAGSTCTTGAVLLAGSIPGRSPAEGRFQVLVRNDCAMGDERLTGVPREGAVDDANGKVVVVSIGTFERLSHTMTAVVEAGQTVPIRPGRTYNWADR